MEEVEKSVRSEIKKNLAKCNPAATPKVCEMIQTPEGYLRLENMIIFALIYGQTSIGAAIAQIEMEML